MSHLIKLIIIFNQLHIVLFKFWRMVVVLWLKPLWLMCSFRLLVLATEELQLQDVALEDKLDEDDPF